MENEIRIDPGTGLPMTPEEIANLDAQKEVSVDEQNVELAGESTIVGTPEETAPESTETAPEAPVEAPAEEAPQENV